MLRLRDPVCGMEIGWEEAVDHELVGPVLVYFCCRGCASRFRRDPTRHVHPRAWWAEGTATETPGTCHGRTPTDGGTGSVVKTLDRRAVPRIGPLPVDDFEALVHYHWRRLLGWGETSALHTRVLERALLLRCLARTSADMSEIDRRLAAEVARLRDSREMRQGDIEAEIDALPGAFGRALDVADPVPAEAERVRQAFDIGLQEARIWLRRRPGPP